MSDAKKESAFQLHYARVLLRESIARRRTRGGFHWALLEWAGNARRRAAAIITNPQPDLFAATEAIEG